MKKRQHYLPIFYLNGFTDDDGKFWIYDRYKNEFRIQTPINTAVEKDYYTILDENGEKNTGIEDILSLVEGHTKPILDKLTNRIKITKEDKEYLSIFIAIMWTRVPDFEKSTTEFYDKIHKRINKLIFYSEERTKEIIEHYEKKLGKKYGISAKQMFDFVHREKYKVKTDKGFRLATTLKNSLNFANHFIQMDWLFAYSSVSAEFITTDNPFSMIPPKNFNKQSYWGYGIITKGTQKIIPLSKNICLIMLDKGENILYRNANDDQIFHINVYIVDNCDRFVIGTSKKYIEKLVKETQIDKWEKSSRINLS